MKFAREKVHVSPLGKKGSPDEKTWEEREKEDSDWRLTARLRGD